MEQRIHMKLKALIGTAVAAAVLTTGGMAAAAPPNTGWDDINDVITGSGSDTTYNFMQRAELVYNQAAGCDTVNTSNTPLHAQCLTTGQTATEIRGNWDHDMAVSVFPTGSGAGVSALQQDRVDYARSSRGPRTSGDSGTNFWAFGKDGVAVVSLTPRAGLNNLSKAQIQGIYNCTITNFSQLGQPAGVIEPVGLNPSSGTKATFDAYLGFDANNGSCVKKLSNGTFPFENDVKPVLADPGINENNAIWWMSYAEFSSFSYKRGSATVISVDGSSPTAGTIANNSYPITRFIYHVTKNTITPQGSTSNLLGPDGGKQGAVRELTEFLCKPTAEHAVNNFSGRSNYLEIGAAYTATGFVRLPVAERTNGICAFAPAP